MTTMIKMLDKNQPRWEADWATGEELRLYHDDVQRFSNLAKARENLKNRVANRLFARIVSTYLEVNGSLVGSEARIK